MRFLFDFFPFFCLFIGYKLYGIYIGTAIGMAASVLQVGYYWLRYRKFEAVHVIALGVLLLFGSMTLIFHSEVFIKWKPTVTYWIFAVILLGAQWIGHRNLLQKMLEKKIKLPDFVWKNLNVSWALFFVVMGFINIYVLYKFSTNIWIHFKLFATPGLIILFGIGQAVYMAKYMKLVPENASEVMGPKSKSLE